ncbi:hypothetical protein FQA39_LY05813 [Lamprigera yunnana]|nr:hypothetical protein FQA39_LY05813 [Lamprigera yunnana]
MKVGRSTGISTGVRSKSYITCGIFEIVFKTIIKTCVLQMSSRGEKLVALAIAQTIETSVYEYEEDSNDSVKDKNYSPSSEENDNDAEDYNPAEYSEDNHHEEIKDHQKGWAKVIQANKELFLKKSDIDSILTSPVITTTLIAQ